MTRDSISSSSYVPKVLSAEIAGLFARLGIAPSTFERFAVHPGGKAILDRFIAALDLPADSLDSSREVLRDNGNMSSATILFVLKNLLEKADPGEKVLATAFGPGLTVELARLSVAG